VAHATASLAGYSVKAYIRVNAPVVALTHVRVIDGTGAAPLEDSTVILSGGRIQAVGRAATTPVPGGAEVLDLTGYSVVPGLVGMHDHMFYPAVGNTSGYMEMGFSFPRLYLASGVTTIRTAGAIQPSTDLRLKSQIDKGWLPGPKMHVTGPYLDGLSGPEEASRNGRTLGGQRCNVKPRRWGLTILSMACWRTRNSIQGRLLISVRRRRSPTQLWGSLILPRTLGGTALAATTTTILDQFSFEYSKSRDPRTAISIANSE